MDDVAVVVTCKGRLAHLQLTAPLLFGAFPPSQYYLVDWGCPERSGEWLRKSFPEAKVIRTEAPGFEKTRAANLGAKHAIKDGFRYLLFLDADTLVQGPALGWLLSRRAPDRFLILPGRDHHEVEFRALVGVMLVPSQAFVEVGGYDTSFGATYGHEDLDLRLRLHFSALMGFEMMPLPLIQNKFIQAIEHSDDLRVRYYQDKSMESNYRKTLQHLERRFHQRTGQALGFEQHVGPRQRIVNQLLGLC
jgi:predicted glycosyltransferase involved in capsule biosynthesis